MLSCCSTSSSPNPFHNVLLDNETQLQALKRESTFYEIAYGVSCVALWILAIGAVFYVASMGAPLEGIILTGTLALLLIKTVFENFLYYLDEKATSATHKYLFEMQICDLSNETIQNGKDEVNEEDFYKDKFLSWGLTDLSSDLKDYIQRQYEDEDSPPYRHLAPLMARAETYHKAAQERLKEIALTFHSIPDDSHVNPHREELDRLREITTQPAYVIQNVREKVRSFEAIHVIKWKEYYDFRFREIFALHVLQNPVHSGEMTDVGFLTDDNTLFDYLLETRNAKINILFAFKPHFLNINRDSFERVHKDTFNSLIAAGLLSLIDEGNEIFITTDDDAATIAEQRAKANGMDSSLLGPFLKQFASEYEWSDDVSLNTFLRFLERHSEELFCSEGVQAAIRPIVNDHFIKLLKKFDLSSLRGRLARALLNKSEIHLEGLPASSSGLRLKSDFFTQDQVDRCQTFHEQLDNPSIYKLFDNLEFQTLLDEIESHFYRIQ